MARSTQSKIHVLLVDNNHTFLKAAHDFLKQHQELIVVGATIDREEALAKAQTLQPELILVGLDRPGLAGLTMIGRLRALLPDAAIIALALVDSAAYRQTALGVGADEFVPKAALTSELLPAIRRIIPQRGSSPGS